MTERVSPHALEADFMTWLRGLELARHDWQGRAFPRMALGEDWEIFGRLWQCERCHSVYLLRSGPPRCPRCP